MLETDIVEFRDYLSGKMQHLEGSWVAKRSAYELDICEALSLSNSGNVRYWNTDWNSVLVKFKKGRNYWFDLVRFGELVVNRTDLIPKILTVFFIPDVKVTKISEVVAVSTDKLIDVLSLNERNSAQLIELNSSVPRSLNAQASLTLKDLKELSEFIVIREDAQ